MARTAPTAKQDILLAAMRCFSRSGFRATSLKEIAHEYGGSKSALLYHFASKDAILEELLRDHWRDVDELARSIRFLEPGEAQRRAVDGMVEVAVRYRQIVGVFHAELREIVAFPSMQGAAAAMDDIARALAGGSQDPVHLATARVVLLAVASACRELEAAGDEELRLVLSRVMSRTLDVATS